MLFNSYVFILAFLPIALTGYFAIARLGQRPAGAWLALSSLAFYGWWNPPFVLLLMGSIAFNYLISVAIARYEGRPSWQNGILTAGIAGDLLVLMHYKYLFPLVSFFEAHGMINLEMNSIVLPLGISFYTFTQIGFLVDCRQGVAKERGLLAYVLFVTFFPHLIAGPILHNREIMPQFSKPETYRFNVENFAVGLSMFIIGLGKKVLIADSLITVVNGGFAAPETLGITVSWIAALAYSLQIYFDFSAYSDMAVGLAYMFNVRFPLNFNSPYKARSIIEFWQRWHMTLTRYLTMYIYNPMAIRSARRRIAKGLPMSPDPSKTAGGFMTMIAVPILITMTIAGVWHGAGLQFLVFGVLHGVFLVMNHVWRTFGPAWADEDAIGLVKRTITIAFQVGITYLGVVVAQVFFRADSVESAMTLLAGMVGMRGFAGSLASGWQFEFGSIYTFMVMIASFFAIAWFMPNSQQIMGKFPVALGRIQASRFGFLQWQPTARWAVATGIVAGIAIVHLSRHTEFLYFQF